MANDTDGADVHALTRALANLTTRDKFKAPVFRGEGDIELYISQFDDVRRANRWDADSAVIHLRSSLEGPAWECGREGTLNEIYDALRARFGLTARQAKDKLVSLKKTVKQTLHEHATEVGRLVQRAFANLAVADRDELTLDYFVRSLDNRALQRHMLAIEPATVMEAVRAAEEFLQVGGADRMARPAAMMVESSSVSTVEASLASIAKVLEAQSSLLTKLTDRLDKLDRANNGGEGPPPRRPLACFICKGPHFKRDCPKQVQPQSQTTNADEQQGNETGPGQQ
jgi:hypothetical protein